MPMRYNPYSGTLDITSAVGGQVDSISGTANRITISGSAVDPIVDIAATYVGQTTLTTLGTVATGTWNGDVVSEVYGGTNQSSYTTGDVLYASASNTLSKLPVGSNGEVLKLAAGIPSWAAENTFSWSVVTNTTDNFVASTGYICDNGSGVVVTLPLTAAVGDSFKITALQSSWSIAQNASQIIHFGDQSTTTGVGGSITSTNARDVLEFICVVANTDFQVLSSIGNLTIV